MNMSKTNKGSEVTKGSTMDTPRNITLPFTAIIKNERFQFRSGTDSHWVDELEELYKSGQKFTGENAIKVAQCGTVYYLYDGFHRYEVMKRNGVEECEVQVTVVPDEESVFLLAMQGNATHGKRFDNFAYAKMLEYLLLNRNKAKFMDGRFKLNVSLLATTMGCSEATVRRLTKEQRDELTLRRDRCILILRREGKTGKEIGKELGLPTSTVTAYMRKRDKERMDNARTAYGQGEDAKGPVDTETYQCPKKPEDVKGPEGPEGDAHRQIDPIEDIQRDLIKGFIEGVPDLKDTTLTKLHLLFETECEKRGLL